MLLGGVVAAGPAAAQESPAPLPNASAGAPAETPPDPWPDDLEIEGPLEVCQLHRDEEFVGLDWARRTTYETVCVSARWLDHLFGEEEYDLKRYPIEGFLGLNFERRRHGTLAFEPKLRLRLQLPNLSRKFELFFERDDENKTIVGESDSVVTRQLGSGEADSPQLGLAYEILRGIDELANFRAGIRLINGNPDPFVRSRYNRTFARGDRYQWRFGETLFWRQLEGFGETTSLEYEHRIGGPFILRWGSSATLSQVTDAFRWGSGVSILHPLDERRTLLYSWSAGGQTGRAVPVENHGPRVSYRQQMQRRWLFGEVYVGIDHTKLDTDAVRGETPYIGAKLEAHFKSQ